MSSYFVCITISRRFISFEYHQEGASKSLAPFPGDNTWPVPLALYCTPSKIEIGYAAERAAARGVPGAFKEWFQQLSSGQTVNYLGQMQPVSHLLLLAAEEQLRRFLKDVRYNMDGGLENCRASMPLVLNFEDDVDDSMRIFLVTLFKNMGYGKVYELFHNRTIASYYSSTSLTNHLLIVDSDGVDLMLSLYTRGQDKEKLKRIILNAGIDPRLQSVCNMIWDKTGAEFSFLDRMTEQPRLEQMATEIIGANQIEYEGMMHYSNGERLSFIVSRSELIASGAGSKSVVADVVGFLDKEAGVKPSDVTVVLRNFAAKNDYFSQAFSIEFPSLIIHEEEAVEESNSIILHTVGQWLNTPKDQIYKSPENKENQPELQVPPTIPNSHSTKTLKEKAKKWRQVRAEANGKYKSGQTEVAVKILKSFLLECESIADLNEIQSEIRKEIEKMIIISPPPVIKSSDIKKLTRDWREVRATTKGKIRNKDYDEAKELLNAFLQTILTVTGTESLQDDVRKELNSIPSKGMKTKSPQIFPPKAYGSERKIKESEVRPHKQAEDVSEGITFIRQEKLKEARDWYRSQNDMAKARILSDIIRSKKGIDLRKNSLEEYKKSKNKEQIKRIISELQEFINLCTKVSMPCDSYKKLLNDYKMI